MKKMELGCSGTPLRASLGAAVRRGDKTATADLVSEYQRTGDPMPVVGDRWELVDVDDHPVAIVETTEVRVIRIADCDAAFARDEGEGFADVAAWRVAHEQYWTSLASQPVTDDTLFVAERFRIVSLHRSQ